MLNEARRLKGICWSAGRMYCCESLTSALDGRKKGGSFTNQALDPRETDPGTHIAGGIPEGL